MNIHLDLKDNSYDIIVERGILEKADGDTVVVTIVNEIGKYEIKTLQCNQVMEMAEKLFERMI